MQESRVASPSTLEREPPTRPERLQLTSPPAVGIDLTGMDDDPSTGLNDELWVKALVLRSNGKCAIILAVDLLGVELASTRQVRERISRQLQGVAADDVMIVCAHNHCGPSILDFYAEGDIHPRCTCDGGHFSRRCARRRCGAVRSVGYCGEVLMRDSEEGRAAAHECEDVNGVVIVILPARYQAPVDAEVGGQVLDVDVFPRDQDAGRLLRPLQDGVGSRLIAAKLRVEAVVEDYRQAQIRGYGLERLLTALAINRVIVMIGEERVWRSECGVPRRSSPIENFRQRMRPRLALVAEAPQCPLLLAVPNDVNGARVRREPQKRVERQREHGGARVGGLG